MRTPRFPGESARYREARNHLLDREIALRREMEEVAKARRALPPGGEVPEDYVFQGRRADGTNGDVRLSELFEGKSSLALYTFMFPRAKSDTRPGPTTGSTARLDLLEGPCPSCTALLDQWEGSVRHVSPRMSLAVVARAPLDHLLAFAEDRGWTNLRFLSAGANTYLHDYFGEDDDGSPIPILNVFERDGATTRHFWGCELIYAPSDPGQDPRHVGTLEPSWNMFDMTREGRGVDWDELFDYSCCAPSK